MTIRSPFFLFLLPVFFVFHGYTENWRNIDLIDCLPLTGIYLTASLVLFCLSWLWLRRSLTAALLSAFIMAFFFFFGALHDFLRSHHIILHKYSLLLPLFGITAILLALRLKKERPSTRLPVFLNVLLIVYILLDLIALSAGKGGNDSGQTSSYPQPSGTYRACNSCPHPDIYFIIFDEYCNSRTLKETFHYDNSRLDSFLTSMDFHIQTDSRSNYAKTLFSMASMLNFSYLHDIRDTARVGPEDFANQLTSIRDNEVSHFLRSNGYAIINNCVFDLAGSPATVELPLIPMKTRLITDRTLLNYIARDLGGWFAMHFNNTQTVITPGGNFRYFDNMNHSLLRQTIAASRQTSSQPRFIYTHILMPHAPYLYDSLGQKRDPVTVMSEQAESLGSYLHYIPYTNAAIEDLIGNLKKNTAGQAVIIFMSDHGYRYQPAANADPMKYYDNQNAIYLPDGDYSMFYKDISAVNEFRVLFNHLFRQNLPLLKDSAVRLHFMDVEGW